MKWDKEFDEKQPAMFQISDLANVIATQQKTLWASVQSSVMSLGNARGIQEETRNAWAIIGKQVHGILPINAAFGGEIEQISETLQSLGRTQSSLVSGLQEAGKQMTGLAGTIQSAVKQINVWEDLAKRNKRITESYRHTWEELQKQYKITEQEALTILHRYKWFISPSMPIRFISQVVKIGKQAGNRIGAMNGLFVDYFAKDNFSRLEFMAEGWGKNELFAKRMKILRDCVQVMKRADRAYNSSNVVLTTLIAQIDGIQQLFMEQSGLTYKSNGKWTDEFGNVHYWKDWYRNITSNSELLELANTMLLDILFQSASRSKPLTVPFTFNRHKIMHGESTKYGRVTNVIRAFLVLDFLANISI